MTTAILFGVLSLVFLICFFLFLDLALFYWKWSRRVQAEEGKKELILSLEHCHKKKKNPIKKNLILFFLLHSLSKNGEGEKAKTLLPFLRSDFLFGIKKEQIKI